MCASITYCAGSPLMSDVSCKLVFHQCSKAISPSDCAPAPTTVLHIVERRVLPLDLTPEKIEDSTCQVVDYLDKLTGLFNPVVPGRFDEPLVQSAVECKFATPMGPRLKLSSRFDCALGMRRAQVCGVESMHWPHNRKPWR